MFISIVINGLITGGMCAILAVGFSLIFGVAKILNLAHTSFYMAVAYFMFIATAKLSLSTLTSAVLAIPIAGILGMICYKLCFDRVKVHTTVILIISVGIAMLFQEIFLIIFASQYRSIPPFISGFLGIYGVRVSYQHFFTSGAILLTLIGVWFLLSKTRLGNAIRAVDQDSEVANLMGINVGQICTITMGLSAVLAGVAGIVVSPVVMIYPLMWVQPLIIVLAAVVLGGIGSLKGSVIAAFILGFTEVSVVFLIPKGSFLKGAVSLVVMAIVLLIRPEGLFGIAFEEERL
jgi:branched-chain amino acid transport system permease protein